MNPHQINQLVLEFWDLALTFQDERSPSHSGIMHLTALLTDRLGSVPVIELAGILQSAVLGGPKDKWLPLATSSAALFIYDLPKAIESLTSLLNHRNANLRECGVIVICETADNARQD